MLKNTAIILAAGSSNRFGGRIPKQFQKLKGRQIIDYSIQTFLNHKLINTIVVVCPKEWVKKINKFYPNIIVTAGGNTRKESSYLGLSACPKDTFNVLIHDAARPLVSSEIISDSLEALKKYEAVNISIKCVDSIVELKNNFIESTIDRSNIYLSQTPQSFRYKIILNAHQLASDSKVTDDIQLIKRMNIDCYNIEGSKFNMKITESMDINFIKYLIENSKLGLIS